MKQQTRMNIVSDKFEIINKDTINNELKNGVLSRLSIWRANVVDTFSNFTVADQDLPEQPKINQENIQRALSTSGGARGYHDGEGDHIEGDDNHITTGSPLNTGENAVGENNYDAQLESEGLAISIARIRSNSGSELLNENEVVDVTTSSKT